MPTSFDAPRHHARANSGEQLTSDGAARGHGLGGSVTDKSRYRLTVDVSTDEPALVKWTEWAERNATPATIRALHATATASDSWYVFFGVIDPTKIDECVDMHTGRAV